MTRLVWNDSVGHGFGACMGRAGLFLHLCSDLLCIHLVCNRGGRAGDNIRVGARLAFLRFTGRWTGCILTLKHGWPWFCLVLVVGSVILLDSFSMMALSRHIHFGSLDRRSAP
ncbi:hypothetical protein BDV59DRAFT_1582 [Aspergillus ambiguus]|uniref:uncharacterized protein n=1 Tax=Aspergillus ambiguus TaxID=176160 RepID=UPI003CCDD7B8